MARHVFQYDRMDTLGLYFSDPSGLPPLRPLDDEAAGGDIFQRPARADTAGLHWANQQRHPGVRDNSGAAHRQQDLLQRQVQQLRGHYPTNTAHANASAPPVSGAIPVAAASVGTTPTYRADGSIV
jgi:hypothetical protein